MRAGVPVRDRGLTLGITRGMPNRILTVCATGSQLTTAQLYSASFTKDLDNVAAYLCKVIPNAPICAVGYSLGANILVNVRTFDTFTTLFY